MDDLSRGLDSLRLADNPISDLLNTEPGADSLPLLLNTAQGLSCGPSQNGLSVRHALRAMSAGEPLEALHYLAETHSTFLRQYMIMKSSNRLAQIQVKAGRRAEGWPAGTQEAFLDERRRRLQHNPTPRRLQEVLDIINQVPPDWTVIQLTAVPRTRTRLSRHATPELVVARFRGGAPESLLLARVPAPAGDRCCTFRAEFEAMLADNDSIQRSLSHDRQKYWTQRGLLDDRMKAIVRSMELAWLGPHASLLSGAVTSPALLAAIEALLSSLPAPLTPEERLRLSLLAAHLPESVDGLRAAVAAALGPAADPEWRRAVCKTLARGRSALRAAAAGRRGQVILVLDREVQRYPWETVGALAAGPVCRMPSLAVLGLCLAARRVSPARPPGGATYILNPAGDLVNTEKRMGEFLEEKGWRGIVGRPPTLKEFTDALTEGRILAYCGHGSGSQYLPAEKLRSLACSAVALLFGCGSGELVQPGPTAEPHGSVYYYFMANCPAVLGNLWSVTDAMLDKYSKAVIERWTTGEGTEVLPEAVSAARSSVTSSFMAAAPVVYGLPVTPDGTTADGASFQLPRPAERHDAGTGGAEVADRLQPVTDPINREDQTDRAESDIGKRDEGEGKENRQGEGSECAKAARGKVKDSEPKKPARGTSRGRTRKT